LGEYIGGVGEKLKIISIFFTSTDLRYLCLSLIIIKIMIIIIFIIIINYFFNTIIIILDHKHNRNYKNKINKII